MTMAYIGTELMVRRLSTPSSVHSSMKSIQDSERVHTTTWCWYHLENNSWIPYGDDVSRNFILRVVEVGSRMLWIFQMFHMKY